MEFCPAVQVQDALSAWSIFKEFITWGFAGGGIWVTYFLTSQLVANDHSRKERYEEERREADNKRKIKSALWSAGDSWVILIDAISDLLKTYDWGLIHECFIEAHNDGLKQFCRPQDIYNEYLMNTQLDIVGFYENGDVKVDSKFTRPWWKT